MKTSAEPVLFLATVLLLFSTLEPAQALAADPTRGCASLAGSRADECLLDSALGSTLTLPLQATSVSSQTGAFSEVVGRRGLFLARGNAVGVLNGRRYRGTPILVFDVSRSWGAYWTALDQTAPLLAQLDTSSFLESRRVLQVEMMGVDAGQALMHETYVTYLCSQLLSSCTAMSETLVAPVEGKHSWVFVGRGELRTATLNLGFVVTVRKLPSTPTLAGQHTTRPSDVGIWRLKALRSGTKWIIDSIWQTARYGTHEQRVVARLGAKGQVIASAEG